jgi:hypothetical protein
MSETIVLTEGSIFEDLRQILIHEMGIESERVNIFNQRISEELLEKEGIFIYLECLPSSVISNRSRYDIDPVSGDFIEIQDLNMKDPVSIGIFSKNTDAFLKKDEVLLALNSHYSQQLQEAHSFRIFRNAPVEDLSHLEGAALLYRYDIPIIIFSWSQKKNTVGFYDKFSGRVKVNDGLPLITKDFDQPTS